MTTASQAGCIPCVTQNNDTQNPNIWDGHDNTGTHNYLYNRSKFLNECDKSDWPLIDSNKVHNNRMENEEAL